MDLIDIKNNLLKHQQICSKIQKQTPGGHHRTEAVARRCSVKKVFLEISQNSQENTYARVPFLIKLLYYFIKKETLTQMFSCDFCGISKNTFFHRTPSVAASDCIHYKTCLSHAPTLPTILSDYKRRICHFRQDFLVCQES